MKKNYTFLILLVLSGLVWFTNATGQNGWDRLVSLPTPRMTTGSCAIDHDIFILGGWTNPISPLATSEKFNTETKEFTVLQNMTTGLAFPSVDTINGNIYVSGGFINNDEAHDLLQEYDPEMDKWTVKKELPVNIGHHVSGVINKQLYVAGGVHKMDANTWTESGSYFYDPSADDWDSIAPMISTLNQDVRNSGRWQASSCVYNGKLYTLGGFRIINGDGDYLQTPEMYNPETDVWTDLAEMPGPKAHHANGLYKGKIYLFGGSMAHDYWTGTMDPSYRVFEYDPEADSWREMEPMPFSMLMCEGHVIDNFLYLVGGEFDENMGDVEVVSIWRYNLDSLKLLVTDAIEQYQGSNQKFSLLPNHPNPFSEHTSICYDLRESGDVELVVYDMLGRKICTLVDEVQIPGQYTCSWDAGAADPGIYFCQLKMKGASQTTIKIIKQ